MKTATDIKMDIAASLWMKPCTFEELCKRFNVAQFGFHSIVNSAIKDGWIYEKKDETLRCYKKTAKMLNTKGYELDIKWGPELSDFEKAFRKSVFYTG